MDTKRALAAAVIVAAVVGGIAWADRENRVQQCRQAYAAHRLLQLDDAAERGAESAEDRAARARYSQKSDECYRDRLLP